MATQYSQNSKYSWEQLEGMMANLILSQKETEKLLTRKFQDTEKLLSQKFQDTDKKFQDTDKKFQDTDRLFKELHKELGGIGKSNGEIAEDFFYTALEHTMQVGSLKFDYIGRNFHMKRNNLEGEYDIVLYNNYKVLIVEVKYRFRKDHLHDFYTEKLKVFSRLFPEYSKYKIYGAIAALTFEKDVKKDAENFGFFILTQNNDKLKVINKKDFAPNEIK